MPKYGEDTIDNYNFKYGYGFHVHPEDGDKLNIRLERKHRPLIEPIYSHFPVSSDYLVIMT